jgi:hypothetical protein
MERTWGRGLTARTPIADVSSLSRCLNAGGMGRQDYETETLIPTIGGDFDVAQAVPHVDVMPTMRGAAAANGPGHGARSGDSKDEYIVPAVAFDARQSDVTCGSTIGLLERLRVRRLTPRECERLQGFPDDYTLIQYRGKPAKDGPRYKAIGNSMAVPVHALDRGAHSSRGRNQTGASRMKTFVLGLLLGASLSAYALPTYQPEVIT